MMVLLAAVQLESYNFVDELNFVDALKLRTRSVIMLWYWYITSYLYISA